MAKAAKKSPAKKAAKPAAKPVAKAKAEKKAVAPKKEAAPKKLTAPKIEVKKETKKAPPKELDEEVVEVEGQDEGEVEMEVEATPAPKISKREKAAKAAADKIISEDLKKWSDFKDKFGSEKAVPYNMSATFEAHQPIQHKVLGWGYILSVQNDRLEVLFESGPKMLISNYKSS